MAVETAAGSQAQSLVCEQSRVICPLRPRRDGHSCASHSSVQFRTVLLAGSEAWTPLGDGNVGVRDGVPLRFRWTPRSAVSTSGAWGQKFARCDCPPGYAADWGPPLPPDTASPTAKGRNRFAGAGSCRPCVSGAACPFGPQEALRRPSPLQGGRGGSSPAVRRPAPRTSRPPPPPWTPPQGHLCELKPSLSRSVRFLPRFTRGHCCCVPLRLQRARARR